MINKRIMTGSVDSAVVLTYIDSFVYLVHAALYGQYNLYVIGWYLLVTNSATAIGMTYHNLMKTGE